MKNNLIKYVFLSVSVLLLVYMLLLGRNAGVTCDEIIHYNHSVSVYNYYSSLGKDQSALNTPISHLQYYGQSYDNIVTILTKWFGIEDVYGFRNIMSTLAGWLTILMTAVFAIWIEGYGAGLIVLILFGLSPTFLGHSQNNLKDVPFALGYIAGIYYILKHLISPHGDSKKYIILMTLSVAFCISIRAGGLLLLCYLFFFFMLFWLLKYVKEGKIDIRIFSKKLILIIAISFTSYFLSILLWPYALQDPLRNVFRSYKVMVQYPDTFRQIFNGKFEWSDFMPWYYLPEFMAITIPLVVFAGLVLFMVFSRRIFNSWKKLVYWALIFTIIFPVIFVIWERSNLYSAWRQFLFVYPGIVLVASIGFYYLYNCVKNRYLFLIISVLFTLISFDPLSFMLRNPEYSYIYYNRLVGGLKGAYGRFETDYYFVSLKEGSEWLIKYLDEKKINKPVKVMANFSVQWFLRNHPEIQNGYFRYEERSQYDWDYAIITNRYIPPFQLLNGTWPPKNAIKVIYADNIPVCAVIERKSKDDYYGYIALENGEIRKSINFFERTLKSDDKDEMIYYNFASALYDDGQFEKSDSALKQCLRINPDFDLALMYLGNIAVFQNKTEEATGYYEKVIRANRKYLDAYVELSKLILVKDVSKARSLLRTCLDINPRYKSAIKTLADTYRVTNPDMARKYDDLAKTIKE